MKKIKIKIPSSEIPRERETLEQKLNIMINQLQKPMVLNEIYKYFSDYNDRSIRQALYNLMMQNQIKNVGKCQCGITRLYAGKCYAVRH